MVNRLDAFQRNERWAIVVSHLLTSIMMMCLATSLTQFLGRFIPLSGSLPVWAGVIAWEAYLSYRVNRMKSAFSSEWLLARGAEWIVLLAVIKLATELQHGWGALLSDLPRWEQNFGRAFFTGEYIAALFILLTVWVLSTLYTTDLAEMEGNEFIRLTTRMDTKQIDQVRANAALYGLRVEDEMLPSNRRAIHNHLLSRTLTVGILMVIISGLLRQDRLSLWEGQPLSRAGALNVVIYFVLGLALFSQTNFLALRAAWGYEHVSINRHLAFRWAFYSFFFLIMLGALAFILPTRYSLGLLETLMVIIGFLRIIAEFIIGIIMLPVLLFFRLLSLLFGGGSGKTKTEESQPVFPTETPAPVSTPHLSFPWWEALKSILFWGVFLVILGYAIYQYVHQNQALLAELQNMPVLIWLKRVWRWLRGQFHSARQGMTTAVQAGLKKVRALHTKSPFAFEWRFLNPHRLTPRQRVVFFYLALVRRGGEAGFPRHPSQTPYSYARTLEPGLTAHTDSVSDMTDAFMEARYSRQEVTPEQASRVKRAWERLRAVLKSTRKRLSEKAVDPPDDKKV